MCEDSGYHRVVVRAIAQALEQGAWDGAAVARVLERAWGRCASARAIAKRIDVPKAVRVVCVGGATLGGSGKTPLAIECARRLAQVAQNGAGVALVGHAYRAKPGRARVVREDDPLDEVGDEAIVAARELTPAGARVVVAPTRAEAVAFAARDSAALVLDGVAQLEPVRASLALLAVDAQEPWGCAQALPPRGDLRAPKAALLAACDRVVPVRPAGRGAWLGPRLLSWDELRPLRIGLLTALARPSRIVAMLARQRVTPALELRARDHGPFAHRVRGESIDLFLATPKCALHLERPGGGSALPAPLAVLDARFVFG